MGASSKFRIPLTPCWSGNVCEEQIYIHSRDPFVQSFYGCKDGHVIENKYWISKGNGSEQYWYLINGASNEFLIGKKYDTKGRKVRIVTGDGK